MPGPEYNPLRRTCIGRILQVFAAAIGLYLLSIFFKGQTENLYLSLMINIAALGLFPAILFAFGFFKDQELEKIKKAYNKFVGPNIPIISKKKL